MTEPAAIDEVIASRNRLVDQRQKAADALSLTLRTIGMGLAAIAYSFVFAASPSAALVSQKTPLFVASAFGAASVFADVLQSFAERQSAQGTLDFLKECRSRDYQPAPREIEREKQVRGGQVALTLLILRAVLCLLGATALLSAIARTL